MLPIKQVHRLHRLKPKFRIKLRPLHTALQIHRQVRFICLFESEGHEAGGEAAALMLRVDGEAGEICWF
jgi:hypothetical protein